MTTKFETILENLDEESILTLNNKIFSNSIILSLQCSILGEITFLEVDFKQIDFTASTFVNCKFKNSTITT